MRGQAAIIPVCFAVIFGVVNGIAIFRPLVVEQRLKTIREQNGIVDHAADEIPSSNDQKKLPVRFELEANKMQNKQAKEMETTGAPNPARETGDEGETKPAKVPTSWYQFWR
ncbi:unnamed protein product [Tuber aestivum]|uniref:Uncharacterized protein n=1 Tax=Tuber aestivum TaxID=59557 RepID=A0A292PKV1_9PEZI|nr:unnamed protein product [Tuber aestivum]